MRLEAYYAYAKKTFLGKSAYRFDHLMGILSTCLQFFIFYEIYKDEIILIEPGKESIHITFRKSERGIGTLAGKLQQEA